MHSRGKRQKDRGVRRETDIDAVFELVGGDGSETVTRGELLTDGQAGRQASKHTDSETCKKMDGQTDSRADRRTYQVVGRWGAQTKRRTKYDTIRPTVGRTDRQQEIDGGTDRQSKADIRRDERTGMATCKVAVWLRTKYVPGTNYVFVYERYQVPDMNCKRPLCI